jgi:hypothetical protein
MNSNDKKLFGGAGGGPAHNDIRAVDGKFERNAQDILLLATPGPDDECRIGVVAGGGGSSGYVKVMGERMVQIRTGGWDDRTTHIPDEIGLSGITVFAPDAAMIQIQRGNFDEPDSQSIQMMPDGSINIDAGTSGLLTLSAGPSYIAISPTGITISAAIVKIN